MEHYMEHSLPLPWPENRFGDSTSRVPDMMGSASASAHANSPSAPYLPAPSQQEHALYHMRIPIPPADNTLMSSTFPTQFIQEAYDSMRGAPSWMPPGLQEPPFPKDVQSLSHKHPLAGTDSSLSHKLPPFSRHNGRDRSNSTQGNIPQTTQTWCQSYINGPRLRFTPEGTTTDAGSSGEGAHDQADVSQGKNVPHNTQFHGGTRDAHVSSSQVIQTDAQQVHQQTQGGQPVFAPLFGTHTGVAQPQGAAAVVAGTARPRVRARRGQATDPHSIAERLRRERIAERMKALQELVPNANKTDKASMLDEIIDYVKFLQLQVKVLSMSRLGGAGAVVPLVADFPVERQINLAAALGSSTFQDGMSVAERQVARLMEEDMGSAMQFLQAKGLCLMPVSLASVISTNGSKMVMGSGGGQQGFSAAIDQSRMHAAASSTSSTLASVASSGYIGGEGDSKSKK